MRAISVPLLSLGLAAGCAPADLGSDVHAILVVPASLAELDGEAWLDHPWPSDLRRAEGKPSFQGFHNPRNVAIISEYLDAVEGTMDGFSPVAPGYLRFDGAIDPTSLPTIAESVSHRSSVQLIDVDPSSTEYGQRKHINTDFRAAGGHYVLPNTLRWMPALGFPLRANTRYAIVVTHALRSHDGGDVLAGGTLEQIVGERRADQVTATLRDSYAPVVQLIDELGTRPSAIRHLSVFTTGDPIADTIEVAEHLRAHVEPPQLLTREPLKVRQRDGWVEYQGDYGPSPNYQRGDLPFASYGDGGEFNFTDGQPEVVDMFDLRFSLSVPSSASCTMPETGWPIVLFAHGTGGGWRSYVKNGYAATLAEQCLATMGVDQIFHGTRPGGDGDPDLLFFNFQNITAARVNGKQSAIDEIQRARLFTESKAEIPAHIAHTGSPIRFDPDKVMFFGHSQGGLNGPIYLALDDSSRGGVLSGSGAVILVTLLEKTLPAPSIADLVPTVFLALYSEELDELDVFHPALMLAQSLVDGIDPINYAHLTVREPLPGMNPKSILMTEGIATDGSGDNYTPPRGTEAQAIAMGLPLQLPAVRLYPQLSYGAPPAVEIPADGLRGNLAGGAASGVLAQWAPVDSDGHFVVFDVAAARAQVAGFLKGLAEDPVGSVPAP